MNRLLVFLFILTANAFSIFGQTTVWTLDSKEAFLEGDSDGVAVTSNGSIVIAPKLNNVYTSGQSYIWTATADKGGSIYLGTGGEGKIFKVTGNDKGQLFSDLAELNVTALAVDQNDQLYAATSPDGKVYKIAKDGKAEVYFEPNEKYIWSLSVMADGSLAVGTGETGKIYRVRTIGQTASDALMYETGETHVMVVKTDSQGRLYAGTDSNGLVIRFDGTDKPFGILDSPLREIHDISFAADGSVYVLGIAESAATTTPTEEKDTKTPKPATSVKAATPTATPKSRNDLTNAKSAVYRILPDGESDVLWSSPTVTGYSITTELSGNAVLIGTSDRGRVYQVKNNAETTLLAQTDGDQVSKLFSVGDNVYAATSNQGKLYSFNRKNVVDEGKYISPVLDAGSTATWGRIWWRSSGNVVIQTRSGNSENANRTWSDWSTAINSQTGGQITSPKAKYLQWRAVMRGNEATLYESHLAYLAKNIAPEILSIQILPTDVGLAANPPVQIDQNIELNGLDPASFGLTVVNVAPRRVYQRAARSFQWTTDDRNSDKLRYDVFYRKVTDTNFTQIRSDIEVAFLTLDTRSFADGSYVLKIVAKDALSNPQGMGLFGEAVTEPFVIDNTSPTITQVGQTQVVNGIAKLSFTASDKGSHISKVDYSVNGGEWISTYPDDMIADSPVEKFTLNISTDIKAPLTVTLRVFDANGNWTSNTVPVKN